jgi:hypothetical protein
VPELGPDPARIVQSMAKKIQLNRILGKTNKDSADVPTVSPDAETQSAEAAKNVDDLWDSASFDTSKEKKKPGRLAVPPPPHRHYQSPVEPHS